MTFCCVLTVLASYKYFIKWFWFQHRSIKMHSFMGKFLINEGLLAQITFSHLHKHRIANMKFKTWLKALNNGWKHFFKGYLDSCCIENQYADKELTALRKQTVITKSIHRGDTLQIDINKLENQSVYYTQCYSNCTSNEKVKRHLKRKIAQKLLKLHQKEL